MSLGRNGEAIVPAACPIERHGLSGEVVIDGLPLTLDYSVTPRGPGDGQPDLEIIVTIGEHGAHDIPQAYISTGTTAIALSSELGQACLRDAGLDGEVTSKATGTDKDNPVTTALRTRLLERVRTCTMRGDTSICPALGEAAILCTLAEVLVDRQV